MKLATFFLVMLSLALFLSFYGSPLPIGKVQCPLPGALLVCLAIACHLFLFLRYSKHQSHRMTCREQSLLVDYPLATFSLSFFLREHDFLPSGTGIPYASGALTMLQSVGFD